MDRSRLEARHHGQCTDCDGALRFFVFVQWPYPFALDPWRNLRFKMASCRLLGVGRYICGQLADLHVAECGSRALVSNHSRPALWRGDDWVHHMGFAHNGPAWRCLVDDPALFDRSAWPLSRLFKAFVCKSGTRQQR